MWTLYACGLDPQHFKATQSALVHNTYDDPSRFPKMIWATNYTRLACATIFTFFFAGRAFAPKCVIDGVNIQDYLQVHFVSAVKHLALRINEAGDLDGNPIIGWESLNEPNHGLVGLQDMTVIPSEQKLQKGTSPTIWQAILTGSGRGLEIDTWDFGGLGPYKSGTEYVDPMGVSTWLATSAFDSRYGFRRSADWKIDGTCIWAQHGVWDPNSDLLLRKDYFASDPDSATNISYEYFTNKWFMSFYRRYRDAIRAVFPHTILFCEPPVLEIPPSIKDTSDDDPNMVFAPHYYDGVTLITKKWNRLWNVDVFGVLRGRYAAPVFAIKVGEPAIRNCLRDQLRAIRDEGMRYMGERPCIFTEFGIPYDMDDRYAYRTGDFDSQIRAMDANWFAVEGCGSGAGGLLWCYNRGNLHEYGDNWNGEDLSIVSLDDPLPPGSPASLDGEDADGAASMSSTPAKRPVMRTASVASSRGPRAANASFRAAQAFVRPHPVTTHGRISSTEFVLRPTPTFTLHLTSPTSTAEDSPTQVFLPEWHFPESAMVVDVSGGKWSVSVDQHGSRVLSWWHAGGEQSLEVKGRSVLKGLREDGEVEEGGFVERCSEKGCAVM